MSEKKDASGLKVSVAVLAQLVRYLAALKIDADKVFRSLGVDPAVVRFPDEQIPKQLDAWTSTAHKTDLSFLGIVRFRARVDRVYKRDGERVELFVGVGSRDSRLASPFSPKTDRKSVV